MLRSISKNIDMSIIPRLSMRISSQMTEAINNQIAYEASAVHAYIAIGSW